MEYSKEFCMATIQKIKNDNDLNWREMAALFDFKRPESVANLAKGNKFCSQQTFEKHFGPIEQYMTGNPISVAKVEEKAEKKVEKPAVAQPKRSGIVLTAGSLSELQELLNGIGWHIEFIPV